MEFEVCERVSYMNSTNPYASTGQRDFAAFAAETECVQFLRRSYTYLFVAIAALISIVAILTLAMPRETVLQFAANLDSSVWVLAFCALLGVISMGRTTISSTFSATGQGLFLAIVVLATALLLWPACVLLEGLDGGLPTTIGVLTFIIFGSLPIVAKFGVRALERTGTYAIGLAVAVLFGVLVSGYFGMHSILNLCIGFAVVLFALGFVLMDTSNTLMRFRTNEHIGAATTLFALVPMPFVAAISILLPLR